MDKNRENILLLSLVGISTLLVFISLVFISSKRTKDIPVSDELYSEPECAYVADGKQIRQTFCYPAFKNPITSAISFAKLSDYPEVILNSANYEIREVFTANIGGKIITAGIHLPSNIKLFSNNLNRPARISISQTFNKIDTLFLILADINKPSIQLENASLRGIEIAVSNQANYGIFALNVKSGLEISNNKIFDANDTAIRLGYYNVEDNLNFPVFGLESLSVSVKNNLIQNSFHAGIYIYGDFINVENNKIYQTISNDSCAILVDGHSNNIVIQSNLISYSNIGIQVKPRFDRNAPLQNLEIQENNISNVDVGIYTDNIVNLSLFKNNISRSSIKDENYIGIKLGQLKDSKIFRNNINGMNFGILAEERVVFENVTIGELEGGNVVQNSDYGITFKNVNVSNTQVISNSIQSRIKFCDYSNSERFLSANNLPDECNN